MRTLSTCLLIVLIAASAGSACIGQPSRPANGTGPSSTVPIERRDPDLDLAANLIGQALFLRCFCADDALAFTASGQPELKGKAKLVDWTLAGVNIQKATRRSPTEIDLEGVRVAVRYAPDRHEWDRHPQKLETMHLSLEDPGDPAQFRRALRAIFSIGIDRALQQSTPPYWQHYFDPGLAWPADELTGVTIHTPGKPGAAGESVIAAVLIHKAEPAYTAPAQRDSVQGTVGVQMVVTPEGRPQRIAIHDPLGYGLDAEAATTAAKLRFSPALLAGQPVAAPLLLRQEFTLVSRP